MRETVALRLRVRETVAEEEEVAEEEGVLLRMIPSMRMPAFEVERLVN